MGGVTFSAIRENVIIFTDIMQLVSDTALLISLRKRYHATLVLILLNCCEDTFKSQDEVYIRRLLKSFRMDAIYSFDKDDCQKYGLYYTTNVYSRLELPALTNTSTMTDCLFVGKKKSRLNEIYDMYTCLSQLGLKCKFYITDVPPEEQKPWEGIIYNRTLSYQEVIDEVRASRCIMDIPISGQKGISLRYFEAVVYQKKLLTLNRSVIEEIYYKPQYMKFVENRQDIKCEFFTDNQNVDYRYRGEYSPVRFIFKLEETL